MLPDLAQEIRGSSQEAISGYYIQEGAAPVRGGQHGVITFSVMKGR